MRTAIREFCTIAGSTLITVFSAHYASAASLYTVTSLPFKPSNLNDRGQVIGQNYLWKNGTVTDLNSLPGAGTTPLFAIAINNNGQIVGGGLKLTPDPNNSARSQGFLSDGTSITNLDLIDEVYRQTRDFGGSGGTTAIDINEQGQILANLELFGFDGQVSSYLKNPDGTIQRVFGGARATALNNLGQVTGYTISRGRSGPGIGLLWENGQFTGLSSPGYCNNFASPNCRSFNPVAAYALNDVGQVVGVGPIEQNSDKLHAFVWQSPQGSGSSSDLSDAIVKVNRDPQGAPIGQDLGTLGGRIDPTPPYEPYVGVTGFGINNAGQIVGTSYTLTGLRSAFLWERGHLSDLNTLIDPSLGWQLRSATKINQQGQIIGIGSLNGQEQGFLLTQIIDQQTVPEPSFEKGLLLGAGALTLSTLLKHIRRAKT